MYMCGVVVFPAVRVLVVFRPRASRVYVHVACAGRVSVSPAIVLVLSVCVRAVVIAR